MRARGKALCIKLALCCALLSAAHPSISFASATPAKQRPIYSGISIFRHVPANILPPGEVSYVIDVKYRAIGPVCQFSKLEESGLKEALEKAFTKLNTVPLFEVQVSFEPARPAPGSIEEHCGLEDQDACYLKSFEQAGSYFGIDFTVRTGVTRKSNFVDIGEKEWTYNRMLETMLREHGYETRIVIMDLKLVPQGVHVLKHIPFTALYSEEMMLQLVGLELLPFSLAKQNLMLAVLDARVGLNNQAGVAFTKIANISEAWQWTAARGDMGIVNITLITMRDRPQVNVGEVMAASLQRLLDSMDVYGLPRISGSVLYSRPLRNNGIQDQITAVLPKDERVRSYDSRVPFETLPSWPVPPPSILPHWTVLAAGLLGTIIAIAGTRVLLHRKQQPRLSRLPSSPFTRTFFGTSVPWDAQPIGHRQPSVGASGSAPNPFLKQAREAGSGFSGAGSYKSVSRNIDAVGDSATETGMAALPEEKRRQQIKRHLEQASSIHSWEIDPASIEICKREDGSDHLLGTGGYGQVYKGTRGSVQDVAIKMLNYNDELQLQQFCVEIQLLKSLSFDRNIVQFYGACLHDEHPMLILELMEGGDLRSALSGPMREEMGWYRNGQNIAMDIIRGICFLHDNRVIHGDLKSRNVLMSRNNQMAKISDVGMARIMTTAIGSQSAQALAPGTFSHAAPELLLGQRCTEKADIFSIGVTLWELITHDIPVRGRLRPVRVPEECPQSISELIDRCLEANPSDRPSAKEVFEAIKAVRAPSLGPQRSSSLNSSGPQRFRSSMEMALEGLAE